MEWEASAPEIASRIMSMRNERNVGWLSQRKKEGAEVLLCVRSEPRAHVNDNSRHIAHAWPRPTAPAHPEPPQGPAGADPARREASVCARWRFSTSFAARTKVPSASDHGCAHGDGVSWGGRLMATF